MSLTLIAVVVALLVGHTAPALAASLRRYDLFVGWLEWLRARTGGEGAWQGRAGLAIALAPPLLLVGLFQLALDEPLLGLVGLLFSVAVLFYCWGPRDLDLDVDAVIEARDPAGRRAAAERLFPDRAPSLAPSALVEAVFNGAVWRWFGVLFWFLLLGAVGALLYRLVALCAQGEARSRLSPEAGAAAQWLHGWLSWPVAQLVTLALALVGDFDTVATAWKANGGSALRPDTRFLGAVARASVRTELAEEAMDYGEGGMEGVPATAAVAVHMPELAELRDAMSLVWRALLLWLAVLALFVIAGWVA